ncbi:MAG: hypothetical protein JWR26_1202, partial [Pedosphaera sp.]|nr:hypothetical protein [Pedosphaera sp.]
AGYYQLNLANSAGAYTVYPGGGADQNLLVVAASTLFTNGFGWSATGNPAPAAPIISGNVLTLSDANGEARSAFFNSPMYIGAFQASFIYQDVGGLGGTNNTTADGVTFCLQNDTRKTAALGAGGGALGVGGIAPSAELALNIYNGATGGPGMALGTNGALGSPYSSTAPVDFSSGDPIAVNIVYGGGVAKVTFTDTTTSSSYSTNVAIGNLPTMLGAQTAYVGFTGASGGIGSTQTITDFAFVPLTTLSATVSGSNLVLTWPILPGGYTLQSESSVTAGSWSNVASPVTQVGGQNQVTVPLAGAQHYYRLSVPVPAQ